MRRVPEKEHPEHRIFRERLAELAEKVGSYYELAKRAGINEDTLRNYRRFRGTEPSRPVLIALARAGAVSVNWLATGESISSELLAQIIADLEGALDDNDLELPPAAKAKAIAILYSEAEAAGKKPERRRILSIVRQAA
jgi:transcriptional regulator with XRE-family HTH domain